MKSCAIVLVLVCCYCVTVSAGGGVSLSVKNETESLVGKSIAEQGTEVGRRIRKHFGGLFGHPFGMMGYGFGLHALAILYWLKVKAVIIAFIIGTAVVWGAKYIWGQKSCGKEIVHDGPIIPFSHGPLWSGQDHIPYAPSYSSGYSSSLFDHHHHDHSSPESYPSSSFLDSSSSSVPSSDFIADKKWKRQSRQLDNEEQISNLVFAFLGVDSDACRRRFVCEWEFRSRRTPITGLVFRLFGKGLFGNYVRNSEEVRSFEECGRAHNECRFIEQNNPVKEYEDSNENNTALHSPEDETTTNDSNMPNNENETESDQSTEEVITHSRDDEKIRDGEVQNSQPEVKANDNKNGSKKNKHIIAEALFNRPKTKLRVVPIRK